MGNRTGKMCSGTFFTRHVRSLSFHVFSLILPSLQALCGIVFAWQLHLGLDGRLPCLLTGMRPLRETKTGLTWTFIEERRKYVLFKA